MKLSTVANDTIILHPETVEEAGLMQWLAKRCEGKNVSLLFDTHTEKDCNNYPALWLEFI
jgi:hypothetical protein